MLLNRELDVKRVRERVMSTTNRFIKWSYYMSYTNSIVLPLVELHLLHSTHFAFSMLSDLCLLMSSKASFNIVTAITIDSGIKNVGIPPLSEIGWINCKTAIRVK